ncbi:mitotic deacetylase-associated SANT domain protein [Monodelphis domestica]|uniref:mitotic deacetylase-associated SANT domain protein n=1 Tax=Monodelphis domestica TaxID=13616 RepID=UPI00028BCAE4|nr:mitotic deacetylase-associated SANT domain protein [Monodelphis domestica]XP_007472917.1 mitotic deacetylase-associated SANT domain protein [Monodelphis domestica]
MNLQAQSKAQNKRKRVPFFSDPETATKEQQQLKEGQYYGHGGPGSSVPTSQPTELPPHNTLSLLNSVVYRTERGNPPMLSQPVAAVKWPNSVMGRVPDRGGDASWQQQPQPSHPLWNHALSIYGGQKGAPHPGVAVSGFYGHPESLKRSQEKGILSMDPYNDAIQQMMTQKAQMELGRSQAPVNSFHTPKKPPGQLPLQPFQLAFGNQVNRHVFRQPPPGTNPAPYPPQQKQQALPQMQLFENFYPQQQPPPPHSQQPQDFSLQAAGPMGQAHLGAHHAMVPCPFPPNPEMNPELLKALMQDQPTQPVLPQAQISFPRRSRRLSKEGILPPSSSAAALDGPAPQPREEISSNLFLHHWSQQQHLPQANLGQPHPEALGHEKSSHLMPQAEQGGGALGGQQHLPEGERLAQNGREREAPEGSDAWGTNDFGVVRGGVIQSTRRRRRASQEANLLTLAQKAVELASLQNSMDGEGLEERRKTVVASAAKSVVEFAGPSTPSKRAREDSGMVPLIIPVSVPVCRVDLPEVAQLGYSDDEGKVPLASGPDRSPTEHKPSVIVTRRRSNRNPLTDVPTQVEDADPKGDGEGLVRKPKQRPRPEPLIIPTKAGTFIAPPVYSNITPYQSHLRSPVRLADHPSDRNFELPPYTPPPILSPVREGSGLYFNAIMSATGLVAPPPITPKSAHRTLLRSNSAEVTPPVLSVMGEVTPVSIEPRINVGTRFQAEIPPIRDRALAAVDEHKADLVWQPWGNLDASRETQGQVEDLLTAACSSIFPGAGTNQELALHCLHEAKGDILATLTKLLLKKPLRPPDHPLANYHYTGSDQWKVSEKKLFNKGIAIYKKDFFLVQKLIQTKTVAQCVEFYYTYKKQVKIGRNGTLTFGDIDATDEKLGQEEVEVDIKSSQRLTRVQPPRREAPSEECASAKKEAKKENGEEDGKQEEQEEVRERSRRAAAVKAAQTIQANEALNDVLILRSHESSAPGVASSRATEKPKESSGKSRRSGPNTEKKTTETLSKSQNQDSTFPCKKCGRVFFKVKSRSAHMKSHAEQEKKAAALKQKEKEAAAAAAAATRLQTRREPSSSSSGGGGGGGGSSSGSSDEDGEA